MSFILPPILDSLRAALFFSKMHFFTWSYRFC